MHEVFNQNIFLVKKHLGLLKAANNFDILDPETGRIIVECREDNLGMLTKVFRFTKYKRFTPFNIELRTPDGARLLRVKRGATFIRSTVHVYDAQDQAIGSFKLKFFTWGYAFQVLDAEGQPVFILKSNFTGRNFRFLAGDLELAHVSKQWEGIGKKLTRLTSTVNYVIEITQDVPTDSPARQLILGTAICIDMVLK